MHSYVYVLSMFICHFWQLWGQ